MSVLNHPSPRQRTELYGCTTTSLVSEERSGKTLAAVVSAGLVGLGFIQIV